MVFDFDLVLLDLVLLLLFFFASLDLGAEEGTTLAWSTLLIRMGATEESLTDSGELCSSAERMAAREAAGIGGKEGATRVAAGVATGRALAERGEKSTSQSMRCKTRRWVRKRPLRTAQEVDVDANSGSIRSVVLDDLVAPYPSTFLVVREGLDVVVLVGLARRLGSGGGRCDGGRNARREGGRHGRCCCGSVDGGSVGVCEWKKQISFALPCEER